MENCAIFCECFRGKKTYFTHEHDIARLLVWKAIVAIVRNGPVMSMLSHVASVSQ